MIQKKLSLFAAVAVLILLATPLSANHKVEEASVLLQKIEANAMAARNHAARLKSFTAFPGRFSWETHAVELEFIGGAAEDMAELMGQFRDIKPHASERQNKAYNYAVTEATKLSDLVEKGIQMLNENKTRVEDTAFPQYEETVEAIYDRADRIVAAVGLAESWEEVREARRKLTASQ